MATEIAIFKLHDGKVPDDATSMAGQVLKDTLNTLTEQKGFQKAYFGRELENPGTFRLFVDWDSVDAHTEFTKTETYGPFLENFGRIADIKNPQMYHTSYYPHPAEAALSDHVSPATEILTVYFPADYSESNSSKFVSDFKKLISVIEENVTTYKASAGGWVEEQLTIPGTDEKAKVFAALIGWTSMEDHLAFRETQAFKDNIHLLRKAKDLKHITVVHYSGTQVNKGPGDVGDLSGDGGMPSVQGEVLNPQGGKQAPPKTAADGSTTKNNDDLKGAANSTKKERQGEGSVGDETHESSMSAARTCSP